MGATICRSTKIGNGVDDRAFGEYNVRNDRQGRGSGPQSSGRTPAEKSVPGFFYGCIVEKEEGCMSYGSTVSSYSVYVTHENKP